MMSAAPDLDPEFDLLVESSGAGMSFLPPPTWEETIHQVDDMTIQQHTPTIADASIGHLPPLLTFHDVGQNAAVCYSTFFSHAQRFHLVPELTSCVAHYHLTAPGHLPDAPALPLSSSILINDLVCTVEKLLDRFNLTRVIALGLGIGAAVLLRAAVSRPKVFAGLVLISPVLRPSSILEKAAVSMDGVFTKNLGFGLSRRVKDRLLGRWLRDETRETNHSLVAALEDGLDRLNASNLVRFLAADTWRDDTLPLIAQVQAKVLLISGKESPLHDDAAEAFSSLNPEKTSWLDVPEAGSLVHDEVTESVAQSLSLFMKGFPVID